MTLAGMISEYKLVPLIKLHIIGRGRGDYILTRGGVTEGKDIYI